MKKASTNPKSLTRNSRTRVQELTTRNARGQTAVIIALSMFLLIGVIGLALDGGSMYVQRRTAQNSADAVALASARVMLSAYEEMILSNPEDVDGTATQEAAISSTLTSYATAHGISRSNMVAYYVTDDKAVITTTQVGYYGGIPFTQGAKGIAINNRAVTDSFFMRVFGWDRIGAAANAVAFMGITADSSEVTVLPIGLYTDTIDYDNLEFGQMYTLLDGDVTTGNGNWGWVDFNGSGTSANTVRAWLDCGFNPSVTQTQWEQQWCPSYDTSPGWGPTQHFTSTLDSSFAPATAPYYIPMLVYGEGSDGWWVEGSSGTVNSNCKDFRDRVRNTNSGNGADFVFPVFDQIDTSDGIKYHLRALVDFWITQSDVSCHPQNTPGPGGGTGPDKWSVQGVAKNFYTGISTGRHGNLRHTSGHVVFLEN